MRDLNDPIKKKVIGEKGKAVFQVFGKHRKVTGKKKFGSVISEEDQHEKKKSGGTVFFVLEPEEIIGVRAALCGKLIKRRID